MIVVNTMHARRLLGPLGCCLLAVHSAAGQDSQPGVSIGDVIHTGLHLDDSGSSVVFRGLPYAAPPVGELR